MSLKYLLRDMFRLLRQVGGKKFYLVQLMIVLASFFEAFSVFLVAPFLKMVVDGVDDSDIYAFFTQHFPGHSNEEFVAYFGFVVVAGFFVGAALSIFSTWSATIFAQRVGARLSSNIYKKYLGSNWEFFIETNSSRLVNNIAQEAVRMTNGLLVPFMQMNARFLLLLTMAIVLLAYEPLIAFLASSVFTVLYFFIFLVVKKRLVENGSEISKIQNARFKLMAESFASIKDVLVLNKQKYFEDKFEKESFRFAKMFGANLALAQTPRYLVEFCVLSSVVAVVLILFSTGKGLNQFLPIIGLYGLAGLKLLPAYQQIFNSLSVMKGNLSSYISIKDDLGCDKKTKNPMKYDLQLESETSVKFENVSYKYPSSSDLSINDISFSIEKNTTVAFVGRSGSGKSTVCDLMLGLLQPSSGLITICGEKSQNVDSSIRKKLIGVVPQSIALNDSSIMENIAFGVDKNDIDTDKLMLAISGACLEDFIASLPDGVNTNVGEHGYKISGGQKQRIGIARALYADPKVIIFDEATSALDNETERLVMKSIDMISSSRTVVMIAHKLKTIKNADKVFLLNKGTLIDSGSFQELSVKHSFLGNAL